MEVKKELGNSFKTGNVGKEQNVKEYGWIAGIVAVEREDLIVEALISAKMEGKSAKARKYQPKWRVNQPTYENISQNGE